MRIFKELKQKDSALLATHSLEVQLPLLPYPLLHNEDYILSNKVKKYATESSLWHHIVSLVGTH